MSDNFDLAEYLKALLRQEPDNPHIKQLLRTENRRKKALGKRSMPPSNTAQAAQARLSAEKLVPRSTLHALNDRLPIDDAVSALIDAGHIPVVTPAAQDASREGMTRAEVLWQARQSVIDGCQWGDYYAKFKLGSERSAKINAKMALDDAKAIEIILADFLADHAATLSGGRFTAAGTRAANPQDNLADEVQTLRSGHDAVTCIMRRLEPLARDKGGSPGHPWRVGFVFGISHGWIALTPLKISGSDGSLFINFVAAGGDSLDGIVARNNDAWSSAIKTAARDFDLADDGQSWRRRPGP